MIITALTILAVIGPIIVYFKQRARKSLQFSIISRTSLFSVREEAKGEIEITYRGMKVENADLVLIEVSNVGDVPIRTEDYETPITFDFGERVQILTAEVTKREPENLGMQASVSGKTISLTPILMNAGDSITLKVIATTVGTDIKASCRIVGVKKLEEAKPKRDTYQIVAFVSLVVAYFSMFGFIYLASSYPTLAVVFAIFMIAGLAFGVAAMLLKLGKVTQAKLRKRSRTDT